MRKVLPVLLLLWVAGPLRAQSLERPGAKERAARAYAAHAWPAPGPERVGVDPAGVIAAGFQRAHLRVDPRSGLATVTYRALGNDGQLLAKTKAALVQLRVHPTSTIAREVLLERLTAVQVKLTREETLGEVAFGCRVAGRLTTLLGVVGNVTYVVRALTQVDVEALAASAVRQARAAPAKERSKETSPRILSCEVGPARVGQPTPLQLDFDPGAAPAAHVAFECTNGASVIATKTGYELYASKPGLVRIVVFACSKTLRVGTFTATCEVAPNGR